MNGMNRASLLGLLLLAGCPPPVVPEDDAGTQLREDERRTELGVVRGFQDGEAWVFLGIPYAAPPVGPLRFRPPQLHSGWDGVRDALEFGSACTQRNAQTDEIAGGEDCLTLNVWAPMQPGAAPRPVMVWIHGGDNMSGSASDPGFFEGKFYDGRRLAERGELVFVSIQYRVGAFGFFSHPQLAGDNERGATGNWGLMDQLAALEWIQRNIAAFGGDPARVTAFGQSAGADDLVALAASPRAAGLIHRAIPMSPGGGHTNPAAVTDQTTRAVVAALNCEGAADEIACLRELSAEALARAPQSGSPLHPDRVDFYVDLDGWMLDRTPLQIFRAGEQNKIPLMLGTTAEEYSINLGGSLPVMIPEANLPAWLEVLFGPDIAPEVTPAYPPAQYGGSVNVALIAAFGDAVHHCTVRNLARAAAATQTEPVYRYVLGHTYSDPRLALYAAAHGFDIPFVFGNTDGIELNAQEQQFQVAMQNAFINFVHGEDPGESALWPQYDATTDLVTVAVPSWWTLSGFRRTQCDLWDTIWSQ